VRALMYASDHPCLGGDAKWLGTLVSEAPPEDTKSGRRQAFAI
jgi:hypothetical protein